MHVLHYAISIKVVALDTLILEVLFSIKLLSTHLRQAFCAAANLAFTWGLKNRSFKRIAGRAFPERENEACIFYGNSFENISAITGKVLCYR